MKNKSILALLLVLFLVITPLASFADNHGNDEVVEDAEATETEEMMDEEAVEEEVVEEEVVEQEVVEEEVVEEEMMDEVVEEEATEEVEEAVEMEETAAASVLVLTIDNATAMVDGMAVTLDAAPFIEANRTMVPLRFVGETLGAEVDWNGEARSVTYTKGDTVMVLTIDSTTAIINGQTVELDVAPVIVADRSFVPVRFVSEEMGYEVDWNQAARVATISQPAEVVEEEVVEEEVVEEEVVEEEVAEEDMDAEAADTEEVVEEEVAEEEAVEGEDETEE